jgi:hypothetical protein
MPGSARGVSSGPINQARWGVVDRDEGAAAVDAVGAAQSIVEGGQWGAGGQRAHDAQRPGEARGRVERAVGGGEAPAIVHRRGGDEGGRGPRGRSDLRVGASKRAGDVVSGAHAQGGALGRAGGVEALRGAVWQGLRGVARGATSEATERTAAGGDEPEERQGEGTARHAGDSAAVGRELSPCGASSRPL